MRSLLTTSLASLVLVLLSTFMQATEAHKILLISDLHLDIYYGTSKGLPRAACQDAATLPKYGNYGCDSPAPLVQSMVDDVVSTFPDVTLTIFTGDWLRHSMKLEPQGAQETASEVARMVGQLPGHVMNAPSMAGSLGNNDFVPDYYYNYSDPTPTPLMAHFASEMKKHNLLHSENESTTFLRCGFYSRVIAPELEVIILNSLIWSEEVKPIKPDPSTDPCGQFHFLVETLEAARAAGRNVYLASHIAPQVNFFNAWEGSSFDGSGHFWQTPFLKRYENITKSFKDTVKVHFYGHTHKFAFMGDINWDAPLFILPAISPIFGNTPSYMVATTNSTTGEILDLEQRTANMTTGNWISNTKSISRMIFQGETPLTVGVLNQAALQLTENVTAWTEFQKVYSGGPPYKNQFGSHGCSDNCKLLYSCCSQFGDYHTVGNCTGGVWDEVKLLEKAAGKSPVDMDQQWEVLKEPQQ